MIFVLQSEGKLFIMKGGVITGKKEDWHDQHCNCGRRRNVCKAASAVSASI